MKPDVSIIIVNWKVRDLLRRCLDSIIVNEHNYNIEIIVVDNNSQDGSSEMLMIKYPQVKMIALEENLGFAKANNIALKQAKGGYIFILNPDTEITKDFFPITLTYLKENPEVSIIGPKILNSDKSLQLSIRRFPDLLSQILIMLKLKNILIANKFLNNYLLKDFDYNKEQEVEQIMGAAMLIRKTVFDKIGLFDQRFFIWFEEVDFCRRAHQAGFIIKYLPNAKIIHQGGQSFGKCSIFKKQIIFNQSLSYYFFKHKPFLQWIIIMLIIPINVILTVIYIIFLQNKQKALLI